MTSPQITFNQLAEDLAHQVAKYHSDHGAAVVVTPDGSGTFTVKVTYPASGTGGQADGSSAGAGSTDSKWQQLAAIYSHYPNTSDSLKVATFAQWALESGHGTSALSTQHLNFGGLKYRDRMAGLAMPVTYTGSDGETTTYCKFDSLDAFVAGYWHFIQSGPYSGWERFNSDAAGFISFIAPNYAVDPQYAPKVAALFDEARGLLALSAPAARTDGATPQRPAWTDLRATFLNRRTRPIQGIVLHDTAGAGTHNDTLYLQNPQDGRRVSVDFTVEKDGSIFKLNPDLPAFFCNHAGRSTEWLGFKNRDVNSVTIGVEIVQSDKLQRPPYYPAAQVKAVGNLCAWLGTQFGFNNSRITTHRQIITDGSRSDPRRFPFDDFWVAYWNALGRGVTFQNALAGQDDGDDAPGDFASSTDES